MAGACRPSGLGNVSRSLPFSPPDASVDLPILGHASASISLLLHTTKGSGRLRGPSHSGGSAGATPSGQRDAGTDAHVDADDDKDVDYVAVTDVADRSRVPDEMPPDTRERDEIIDHHRRSFYGKGIPT